MSITLQFTHKVEGVLTNATSVVLSDPTGTFGVKRNDTDEVVIADGTAMTNVSTGVYRYSFDEPDPGLTYTYFVEWVYAGITNRAEFTATGHSADAEWTYSDQTRFNLFNGRANTDIETDLDNDTVGNPEVLQASGDRGDIYIDSRLAEIGWPVPLTGMDDRTSALLMDLSNHAARWQLAESRQFATWVGRSIPDNDQTAMAKADKKYVDDWLNRIAAKPSILVADGSDDLPSPAGTLGSVDIDFGESSTICDENGCGL